MCWFTQNKSIALTTSGFLAAQAISLEVLANTRATRSASRARGMMGMGDLIILSLSLVLSLEMRCV